MLEIVSGAIYLFLSLNNAASLPMGIVRGYESTCSSDYGRVSSPSARLPVSIFDLVCLAFLFPSCPSFSPIRSTIILSANVSFRFSGVSPEDVKRSMVLEQREELFLQAALFFFSSLAVAAPLRSISLAETIRLDHTR